MKKIIIIVALLVSHLSIAQYCVLFEIETQQPEMVVSTLTDMMQSDWGKNIQGKASLFANYFNGKKQATHNLQICFQDEAGLQHFMTTWSGSKTAQLFSDKINSFTTRISQSINTPIWYQNDWSKDNVFMLWELEVSNTPAYAKEFSGFAKEITKKLNIDNSIGIGHRMVGQTDAFTHFAWTGSPDIATALSRTKAMYADPLFATFNKKVAGMRKVKGTRMSVRLVDFN